MIRRGLVAIACVSSAAAHADVDHCDIHSSAPPEHPLSGKLRWDLAATGLRLADNWKLGAGLSLGVSTLFDKWYQSVDLGIHATFGTELASTKLIDAIAELELRWYPVKLRQAKGIDECGCGTKTRRWSEHSDGIGYLLFRAGYGHMRYVDVATRDAFLAGFGVGYELNLKETPKCPTNDPNVPLGGNRRSLFVQTAWRWDVFGNTSSPMNSSVRVGGLFIEAGARL